MIVIPAAGEGRRFKEAGYKGPKHMIPLAGRPMIEWVIENMLDLDPLQTEVVVATDTLIGKTSGAVETLSRSLFGYPPRADEPLIIANCDQLIGIPSMSAFSHIANGLIFTFRSASSAHSYVSIDKSNKILDIIEKPAYVDPTWQAVSGVYVFPSPTVVMKYVDIQRKQGAKGEQFFSSVLKLMIEEGYSLYAQETPTAILGTPEDFQRFETAASIIMGQESRLVQLVEGLGA